MRPFVLVLIAAVLACIATPARAQEASVDAEAKRLFVEGRALVEAGDHAAACKLFEQSFEMVRGLGVQYNLAKCFVAIGRTASAHRHFLEVVDVATRSSQPDRAEVARVAAAELEPRLIRIRITVEKAAPGMILSLDGEPLDGTTQVIAVDPGDHRLEAVAPDRASWDTRVTAAEEGASIDVAVPPLDPAKAAASESPAPLPDSGLDAQAIAGFSIGAIGLGGLIAAAGVAIAAKGRDDAADSPPLDDVAAGLLIAGSVLAAGGLVLVLTSSPEEPATAALSLSVGYASAGILAAVRF